MKQKPMKQKPKMSHPPRKFGPRREGERDEATRRDRARRDFDDGVEVWVNHQTGVTETRPIPDLINQPPHYTHQGDTECIEVIESLGHGAGFCIGNALKYLWRAGRKAGCSEIDDLLKARWYLDRAIRQLDPTPRRILAPEPIPPCGTPRPKKRSYLKREGREVVMHLTGGPMLMKDLRIACRHPGESGAHAGNRVVHLLHSAKRNGFTQQGPGRVWSLTPAGKAELKRPIYWHLHRSQPSTEDRINDLRIELKQLTGKA